MEQSIARAIARCNPDEALKPGDPRRADFDKVRGATVQKRIFRLLESAGDHGGQFRHQVLAGHRGSGKSTELNVLIEDAKKLGYLPLYAGVTEAVDENEVGVGDVFRLMAQMVDERFSNDGELEPLSEQTLQVVEDWFREVTRVEEKEVERSLQFSGELGIGGQVEGSGEISVPMVTKATVKTGLGKLLAAVGMIRKSTTRQRQQIREEMERYPVQLVQNVNLLLDEATKVAVKRYPKGILFVLDNVDRYTPENVTSAFIQTSELIHRLRAHLVFTAPISLLYNPVGDRIDDRYPCNTLPMLPVWKREPREPNAEVAACMVRAIYQRVDPSVFAAGIAEKVALYSGGCPRDMLRLLQEALLEAEDKVDEGVLKRAVSRMATDAARRLTSGHFQRLAKVHLDKQIDSDEIGRLMLYRRDALEYNGEGWVDAHPLLMETRRFQEALEAERKARWS